jgi:hypothetical protein
MAQPGSEQFGPDAVISSAEETNVEPDQPENGTDPAPSGTAQPAASGAPGWQHIQALFVDDPRQSMQLAADAADAAVSALVDSLHERQTAIARSAAAAPNTPGETEELREMLRSYRVFCEGLPAFRG